MKDKNKVLEARVAGVNEAHDYANKLWPKLAAVFEPLVGQKIEKVDGGLLEKVKKQLPELPNTVAISVNRYHSNYSLSWTVKTCKSVKQPDGYGHAYYYERSVTVGELRHGVLTKLVEQPHFKTDYNAKDILAKREAFKAAEKVYDEAKSALFPFGEYDR